jgi:hypothetical protein
MDEPEEERQNCAGRVTVTEQNYGESDPDCAEPNGIAWRPNWSHVKRQFPFRQGSDWDPGACPSKPSLSYP